MNWWQTIFKHNTASLQGCEDRFIALCCMPVFSEVWLRGYEQLYCNIQYSINYTLVFFLKLCALLLRSQMCTYCTTLKPTVYTIHACPGRYLGIRPVTNKYDSISTRRCTCFIAIHIPFCTVYKPKVAHDNIKWCQLYCLFLDLLRGWVGERGERGLGRHIES